jgi:hypothetical protein
MQIVAKTIQARVEESLRELAQPIIIGTHRSLVPLSRQQERPLFVVPPSKLAILQAQCALLATAKRWNIAVLPPPRQPHAIQTVVSSTA